MRPTSQLSVDFDVVVIGAGLGGLYSIVKMRKLGLSVCVYEAGAGVGGTWYWNRYPGCRCDVESLEYSYSFSEELEQEWHWPERYATQPQILKYIEHVADRFDLRKDIEFNTRVQSAEFDSEGSLWSVRTDTDKTVRGRYLIMATGNLSTPRLPDYTGMDTFQGECYHTGMWPHDGVDFSGKRVGVVGTGSSGVQSIPIIAEQATHLTVFQRTANFILPARNGPQDLERERAHKAKYREHRRAAFDTPFGIAGHPPPTQRALEASAEEREAAYAQKWAFGGQIAFLFAYKDLLTDSDSNETAAHFVREQIRETVNDPVTAERLCPTDHPIGTKRLILDTNYFEVFNREHVDLVDIRAAPIKRITPTGIETADGHYELDAIVFATGFDAMTGAMREIDIRTDAGANIQDAWEHGPQTYLGVMMTEFPNLFMITGPQSPGVKSQMILSIQVHVDFIAECLGHLQRTGNTTIVPTQAAQTEWVRHNNQVAEATLYPRANSWYMGANVPGKPRVFMPYVGGVHTYQRKLDEVIEKVFTGFETYGLAPPDLSDSQAEVSAVQN
jgi:cyclohexanone monooxygenase